MNGNGDQPQPQLPPMPNVVQFKCVDCQEDLVLRIPQPVIANGPTCTMIAFPHELPDSCPKCGAMYLMRVNGIGPQMNLMLSWVKVQTQQSAILAPTDNNLKAALMSDKIAKGVKQ